MKKFLLVCGIIAVTLTASVCKAAAYKDTIDTKYEGIVESLNYLKIVNGTTSTTFEPNKTVTRAEMAKMLVVAHGYDKLLDIIDTEKTFKDVKKGSWYYDYVYLANAHGLIKGYPDNTFLPDKEVSYSEAVAMILRSLGHGYIKEDSEYGWDFDYIVRMRSLELNKGLAAFNNSDKAKRGDVAILIWNMLNKTTWNITKEDGNGELTYSDSGEVLFNKIFGDEYKLVNDKKIKSFGAMDGEMYANVETLGEVRLNDVLPIYALGAEIDGVYGKNDKKMVCATYDIGNGIEKGFVDDLEKDGYKIKNAKNKYSIGGNKNDYVFFAVSRDSGNIVLERAVVLDLNSRIEIETLRSSKEITKINGELEIDTSDAILLNGKKKMAWKDLKKGDSILCVEPYQVYIYVNDYIPEEEKDDDVKSNDTELYYISEITYRGENAVYIKISRNESSKVYEYKSSVDKLKTGDCVLVTIKKGIMTGITKATEKEYSKLGLKETLILNLKNKEHVPGMIGKYKISGETKIYEVQKKYRNNSNTVIENCKLVSMNENELNDLNDETVNVILEGNTAKAIFVEREYNSFSVFYARVREVITEKGKIKLSIAPLADVVRTYDTAGLVNCEAGDLITYTLSANGKSGSILRIEEVYHSGVIGYEKDLIVKDIKDNMVYLENGEKFSRKDTFIKANDKLYNVDDYVVILAKVAQNDDGWKFVLAEFENLAKVRFAKNDRIAIDELENTIVIYRGYEE